MERMPQFVYAHYTLSSCEHICYIRDLPPLFKSTGFALSLFLPNRFSINEVIEKTVIIHDHADNFTTQPSGNSDTEIACGVMWRTAGLGV
jgi:Cu-Zn family superoxide dismutase